MVIERNHLVYFSPTHTSQKVARAICEGIGMDARQEIDLTTDDGTSPLNIKNSVCVIASPVYAGRVPVEALKRFSRLRPENSLAVVVAVYGNRHYDDALIELRDEAERMRFKVIAAASFIGEHSYSRPDMPVAEGRPDVSDLTKARDFGRRVKAMLDGLEAGSLEKLGLLQVPGNYPYKPLGPSMKVAPVSTDNCSGCGECVDVCPTKAITVIDYTKPVTDVDLCIKCCACVKMCPCGARVFDTPFTSKLHAMCAERREPEVFFIA